MRNIFILYIPNGNYEAQVHYQDTIRNRVDPSRIFHYVDFNLQSRLKSIFGGRNIAVWGSRDTAANRSKFERMQSGDDMLIVEGDTIKLLGKVPDFIIRLNTEGREAYMIIETKGFDELESVKKAAADRWINAVNIDKRFGHWQYAVAYKPEEVRKILDKAIVDQEN